MAQVPIEEGLAVVESKVDDHDGNINHLYAISNEHRDEVDDLESKTSSLEGRVDDLEDEVEKLKEVMKSLGVVINNNYRIPVLVKKPKKTTKKTT